MSGFFGVVSKDNCVQELFYGIDYHSHLGTEHAGMAIWGKKLIRKIHNINNVQFKSRFIDDLHKFEGNKGIGIISDRDAQPIYLSSKFGKMALCMTGFVENAHDLAHELYSKKISLSEDTHGEVNTVEIIAKLITMEDTLIEGIEKMFSKIQGSCSLLILTEEGLYVARDKLGYNPIVIGYKGGSFAATSETTAFENLDYKIQKFVKPGEIVLLTENGIQQQTVGHDNKQICSFLWIYTGFPASTYEDINVEIVREQCGRLLAKRDNVEVDIVSGVPDSGLAHAIGYAMESKKPYRRPLVKYTPGYGRSYIPPSQEIRDLVARMKLIPIKDVIKGNRIILCEDSIVRGTQLKNFTLQKLWDNGAKAVHVRPACPPLMFPCRFNLSTRDIDELAARRAIKALEGNHIEDLSEYLDHTSDKYKKMVEWIKNDIGTTTLMYQTIEDMVKAIGLKKEELCLYCWNGKCPASNQKKEQVEVEVEAR